MPVSIPKEAKTYTSVYDSFKGVDLTSDASNVWKRRSPSGKNMLPDIDGRPFKRKGWKVEIPYTSFITAAGSQATGFTPERIHHFSLGGEDHMMIFNSLGVFCVSESSGGVIFCKLGTDNNGTTTVSDFPPTVDGETLKADEGRSFFFEGNGSAGFYVFVGTDLFVFRGIDEYNGTKRALFWRVDPYIPRVLIACDKYGAGSQLEPVNLMTRKRTVQYLCDGETKVFVLPNGVKDNEAKVELLTANGKWDEVESTDATYGWSISQGVLTFSTTAPPVVIEGEDNMRITYEPDGGYVVVHIDPETHEETQVVKRTVTEAASASGTAKLIETKTRTRKATLKYSESNHTLVTNITYGSWSDYSSPVKTMEPANFGLLNETSLASLSVLPSGGTLDKAAYGNQITYKPLESAFDGIAGTTTTETSTSADGLSIGTIINRAKVAYIKTGKVPGGTVVGVQTETVTTVKEKACTAYYNTSRTYSATTTKQVTTMKESFDYEEGDGEYMTHDASAFTDCRRAFVYGSGLYNQVFFSSSSFAGYNSRVWYSMADDPTYVPDTSYIEAGGDDTHIVGMMKVSGYVGIIKQGSAMDASVYLAYPTSFDNDTTFAVQQSINGVGALANGAFNILNAEPLFLSAEGVMGIEVSEQEVDRKIRSRSYYINKKLCAEEHLENAISFVHKGMYFLVVNNHCYVLDGSQKTSWQNEKTNLQYECYYLENVPAQCFSAMGGELYFTDSIGNLCRFKNDSDEHPYRDDYSMGTPDWITVALPAGGKVFLSNISGATATNKPQEGDTVKMNLSNAWFTVTGTDDTYVYLTPGVPIVAVWNTIADDDGMVQFFKNLQKKGCLVSLLPMENTGVRVFLKADEKDAVEIGEASAVGNSLPFEFYTNKKIKKYKRLQIICENDRLDQGLGIDQIIKTYTIGNYSKNRR